MLTDIFPDYQLQLVRERHAELQRLARGIRAGRRLDRRPHRDRGAIWFGRSRPRRRRT